jgi:hypothetical protein
LGVALAWPVAAGAGEPDFDLTSAGQPVQTPDQPACNHKHRKMFCASCREAARADAVAHGGRGPRLCARCMAQRYPGMAVRAPGASGGTFPGTPSGCTACQAGATVAAGPTYVMSGEAPGQVIVGMAPGTSFAGGTVLSTEPAPVGVMRTSLNAASRAAAEPPGYATVGAPGGPGMGPAQAVPPAPEIIAPSRHKRPHVLTHLFGLDALAAGHHARVAKRESAHASIAYGPLDQHLTELPASMVYGR